MMSNLKDRIEAALKHRVATAHAGETVSKAELARRCGVKPPSVNAWFSGATKTLKGQTLIAAASYLRVRPEWLSTGLGPMLHDSADAVFESASPVNLEVREPTGVYEINSPWPFSEIDKNRYFRLTPVQQGRVQQAMLFAIEQIEEEQRRKAS